MADPFFETADPVHKLDNGFPCLIISLHVSRFKFDSGSEGNLNPDHPGFFSVYSPYIENLHFFLAFHSDF